MPVLLPSESITAGASSNVHLGLGVTSQEGANVAHRPEGASALDTSQSMMNMNPTFDVPVDPRSASQDSARLLGRSSPTSTTGTASSSTKSTRKNAFSVPFRTSSRNPPVETTPLPPRTPTKAAKLLGVPPGRARVESPLVAQHDGVFDRASDDDDIDEPTRPRDPYGWEQQYTDTASVASSDTLTNRAREEDLDPNPPKSKSFWGSSRNKAKELLESLSPHRTSTELPSHVSMASSFSTPAYKYEDESLTNLIHSIGSNQPNHPIRDPPSPPTRSAPLPPARRRKSKRKPGKSKFNNAMSPITEASRDDKSAHGNVAQGTLRDAVSSDTPTDESAEKEKMMVHGKPMELSRAKGKLPVRSPLQTLEADCLTAAELAHMETVKEGHEQMKTEGNLPLRSSHQALVEADLLTAAEAAHMETVKEGHEQMKKGFAALTCRDCERGLARKDGDAVSISSSIDLDEEPTVHTAVAMTYRRVLPGEVKLVDIPARKKKLPPVSVA